MTLCSKCSGNNNSVFKNGISSNISKQLNDNSEIFKKNLPGVTNNFNDSDKSTKKA